MLSLLAKILRRITEHPLSRLVVGITVAGSGLDDLLQEITGSEGAIDLDVSHGAILFGLFHAMKALGDVLEGLESLGEAIPSSKAEG